MTPSRKRLLWAALLILPLGLTAAALWIWLGGSRLPRPGDPTYEQYVEAFETGTAALDVGLNDLAEKELTRAISLIPAEPAAWVNRGLTYLRSDQLDKAKADLNHAARLAPGNPDVEESLSFLAERQGRFADAAGHVSKALEANPDDVRRLYRLATLIEINGAPGADEERMKLFDRISKHRPKNLFILAERLRLAAQLKDRQALADSLARLEKLAPSWSAPSRELFAKLKQKAQADFDPADLADEVAQLANVLRAEPNFAPGGSELLASGFVGTSMQKFLRLEPIRTAPDEPDLGLTFERREDCKLIEGIGEGDAIVPFWVNDEAGFRVLAANSKDVSSSPKITLPAFPSGKDNRAPGHDSILVVDLDNDGRSDVVMAGAGGVVIARQDEKGAFADVTAAAKLPGEILKGDYVAAWAADVEMDGDLDVILARREGPPVLLRNNSDGTLTPLPIFAEVASARAFVWADLDNDGSPDAALLDGRGRLWVFMNQRSGVFEKRDAADPEASYVALTVADANDDGAFDLIALAQDGRLMRQSQTNDGWQRGELAKSSKALPLKPGEARLQAIDLDSNGAVDLVLRTPEGGVAWLADGKGGWSPLEGLPPGLTEVFPHDGSLMVVSLEKRKPACFVVKGTKGYNSDLFRLRAVSAGDQRVNSFGLGGELEVLSGTLVTKQVIASPAVHVGLGRRKKMVVARIVWTNGNSQVEFEHPAGETIKVEQRLKGSCPFLFAWDGKQMAFVTDFCWSTPLGLYINAVKRGGGFAQTTEWLKVRGDQLVPRDGAYDLRVSATLWETHYLDQLALMVVDHPPDTELYLDERFFLAPTPPRLYLTTPSRPVAKALDHDGDDVTAIVAEDDGKYLARAGLGKYQGLTRDHWVTIDAGDVPGEGPLYLLARGWLQPTDSSLNVALTQRAGERPTPLTLEVPDGAGWKQHGPPLGFPAGKNKTCVIRLDDGMRKVRLRTNMEIYWDSLRVARGLDEKRCRTTTLTPTKADLRYRGALRMTRQSRTSPEIPQYDRVIVGQPWRDLIGFHTRFGDVGELVAKVDDRYVMMNAGDELRMTFAVPEGPPGWRRDFVWVSDGWTKDGDLNTKYGKTVLPLPSHDMKDYDAPPGRLEDDPVYRRHREDWRTYHTRYVTPGTFRQGLRAGR